MDAPVRPVGMWQILSWIGILKAPNRRLGIRFRRRFLLVFLPLLFLGGAGGGLVVYSTSPSFCRSCHIMEPYYQGWLTSHHKDVACVDCHYPPGEASTILWKKFQAFSQVVKFVTRTYSSRPYAEVEDASCLRSGCHSSRLLQGKLVTEKGVRFDHRPHLEGVRYGRQLRCVSCHSQVVVGKHIEVTWDTCYLCHLKEHKGGQKGEPRVGCLGCHEMPKRQIQVGNISYDHRDFLKDSSVHCETCHDDAVLGTGEVDPDRCRTCHNQPEKLARFGDISFIHDNHVTKHNTACFHCHREIRHGATPAGTKKMGADCANCHINTHNLQRQFYMGQGAQDVAPMPSPMYLANVDCTGCHISSKNSDQVIGQSRTEVGTDAGCIACHGKGYVGIMDEAHAFLRKTVERVKTRLTELKAGLPPDAPEGAQIDAMAFNLKLVRQAHLLHNIYYAAQILRTTDERLEAIAKSRKIAIGDTSNDPVLTGAFCATLCHVRVGVQVPPKTVTHDGKEMPHEAHFTEMACSFCHTFGAHKEVKLKTPVKCNKCHEEDE